MRIFKLVFITGTIASTDKKIFEDSIDQKGYTTNFIDHESLIVYVENSLSDLKLKHKRSSLNASKSKSDLSVKEPTIASSNIPVDERVKVSNDPKLNSIANIHPNERTAEEKYYWREQHGFECYVSEHDQFYRRNETWLAQRNLGGTLWQATYECTCLGGNTGRYVCKPNQVPCLHDGQYHEVGSEFQLQTEYDRYNCYCYGGANGKYMCQEARPGCVDDRWNKQKYDINEHFIQTRDDGLMYDCTCTFGNTDKDRVITCKLNRYCFVNNENYELGDKFDVYNEQTGEPEKRCECKQNPQRPATTNLVECFRIGENIIDPAHSEFYYDGDYPGRDYNYRSRSNYRYGNERNYHENNRQREIEQEPDYEGVYEDEIIRNDGEY